MQITLAGDPDREVFEVTIDELEAMREWRDGAVRIVAFDDGGAGKLDVGGVRWDPDAWQQVTRQFEPLELFRWARRGGMDELLAVFTEYYSLKSRPRLGQDDYGPFIAPRRPPITPPN